MESVTKMNTNKRSDNRSKSYTNGPANGHANRMKNRPINRNVMEGVYGNSRFSYGVTSLIGCPVRVEVKNGSHYEGIFLTFSPKMEIVLQMAHPIEGKLDGPYNKDQLIDAMIFKAQDVLSIVAINVDLDYATRDLFTDAAISKFNGEVIGRELERWDNDGGPSIEFPLESGENGWEVEEMFKTNAEKYNVKSSYDANLSAYTTKLEVDDSAEGRAKAARAARLASEIEGSDAYRRNMELENTDEGESISAVIKEPAREQSSSGRYVPPHLRNQYAAQHGGQVRGTTPSKTMAVNGTNQGEDTGNVSPPQPTSPSVSTSTRNREKGNDEDNEQDKNKKNLLSSPTSASSPVTVDSQISTASKQSCVGVESKSGDEPETKKSSPVTPVAHKPLQHSKSEHCRSDDHAESSIPASSVSHHAKPRVTKPEHKKSGRDELKAEINELRDFSDNFNIKLESEKEKRPEPKTQRTASQTSETVATPPVSVPDLKATPQKTDSTTETVPPQEDPKEPKKKSTLNPNAPEFTLNPNAREFKPAVAQVSTSPRPQPQSPVIQQTIALHAPQQLYASAYMAGPLAASMIPAEPQAMPKRAVVSVVRADPSAQALAATGTPLQAQPVGGMAGAPQYTLQPIMFGTAQTVPQSFAQGPMYSQPLVPMPNNCTRLVSAQMGPQMTQIQYSHPHHQQMSQVANVNLQQQQQHMYIAGPGISQPQPAAQMMPPNQQPLPQHYGAPHHGSRSTPPQQTSHPNQGPQQQNPAQGQPQPHHPSQQPMYHHNGQIPPGGQPPLQPSPHTPASPQAQQAPVIPMSYTFSQPPIPTQTHNPAMHQIATNYMQVAPQVSYTAHHAHGPPPQNHVMMVQQTHQHHLQGQPHHMTAHGPPQMQAPVHMSQSGHPMPGPQPPMAQMSMGAGQLHYAPQPSPR